MAKVVRKEASSYAKKADGLRKPYFEDLAPKSECCFVVLSPSTPTGGLAPHTLPKELLALSQLSGYR